MSTMLRNQPPTLKPIWRLLLAALALLVIILVVFMAAFQYLVARIAAPADLQPTTEIDLSIRSHDGESLGQFTLEETSVVTIAYTLPNVDTSYFDLRLVDSAGESLVIQHGEDYRTDEKGGGTWEKSLPPGEYRLVLTADQSPGVLGVYWSYSSTLGE